MQADINLQAWFDVHAANGITVIAPYVSAAREVELQFDVRLLSTGQGSSSNVSQAGTLHVVPGRPSQVSSLTVTPQPGGRCEVGLTLRDGTKVVGRYTLDCSRK